MVPLHPASKSSHSVEGPKIVASTSSPVWYRLYGTHRPGASRESVMVGNRGPVVEGYHSLTSCFTNLPTIAARCIATAPHSPILYPETSLLEPNYPPRPLSFPTPGKTVPHHPLGDGHQVTVPHPPLGDRTTTVHAHLQAQKLQHKTKEFSIRYVQRAANVRRPTP